jgi:hypothetical protein
MEKRRFIFVIETERHFSILIRLLTPFARRRIGIHEIHCSTKEGDEKQCYVISISETKDHALFLQKKLEKEIDVCKVNLFEQTCEN